MKVGDMVKQAPNIFTNRKIGGKVMMVIDIGEYSSLGTCVVTTLLDSGELCRWNEGALEVVYGTR